MASTLIGALKDVFAHHRKFTQFQKVLICSIFVGVHLCVFRSWWSLFVSVTYILTVYASVTVTKYIIRCEKYFPSDVILAVYETVCNFVTSFTDQVFKSDSAQNTGRNVQPDNIDRGKEKNNVKTETSKADEDKFYDTIDSEDIHVRDGPGNIQSDLYCERTPAAVDDNEISSEIYHIVGLIKQDFIESWYKLFSQEKSVLLEAEIMFSHIVQALKGRLHRANTKKLFEFILLMFKDHVHFIKEAQAMFKVQSKSRRRKSSVKPTITVGGIQTSPSKSNIVFKSVEECYMSKVELHLAVKSTEGEHAYQKSIVELLLVHLLREDMHDSKALNCALKEILTCNVLQKVMDLLSETTFLHERIIKITSDETVCASIESIPLITVSETDTSSKQMQSILTQRITSKLIDEPVLEQETGSAKKIELKSEENTKETCREDSPVVKWKEDTELHTISKGLCNECNRLCSADKGRISPRPHSCSLGRTPVFFDISVDPDRLSLQSFNSISSTSSRDSAVFCEKPDDIVDAHQSSHNQIHDLTLNQPEKSSTITCDHTPPKETECDKELSIPSPTALSTDVKTQESLSSPEHKSSSNIFPTLRIPFTNPLPSFPFRKPSFKSLSPTSETAASAEAKIQSKNDIKRSHSQGDFTPVSDDMSWPVKRPSVFQDVRITTTEKMKEVGSFGEYTLYNVEYEALYQSEVGDLVYKSGTVKRRFREFINLQSRLEDNPSYKKSMKDVKGPKKILPSLPFGNMGKDTVDSRKELLELFLAGLVGKEDICNGEELKQFLGYSGDGHIAFVRKVPENTGPRIDQRIVKTMSGVFDKIVEGLPSMPQQMPRIISPFDQREEKDDLPDDKLTEDKDDIDLVYEQDTDKVSSQKIESTFEKFIDLQSTCLIYDDACLDTTLGTSVLTWQDQQGTNSSHMISADHMADEPSHMTQTAKNSFDANAINQMTETDNPLGDAVLNILVEVLQRQDHWVCRDNVKQAASVLLGKGLNRFLEEKVDFLTSTEMNIFYLKTLRETIWPNGQLSTEEAARYTDLQKEQIRQQAKRCLAEFLPGILRVVIGTEEFDEALEEVMESLKYEKLNRHFWYSVFDVVLEELFPEVNTQGFQRKLSATVQSE